MSSAKGSGSAIERMKVVILQSNYLPWKGYFDLIHDADIFVFYDEVQYTKNDWRNRNRIYSKNGLHWLTVPISKDSVKKNISEVTIDDRRWQKKHYTSLCSTYGRAPFWGEISELLDSVYLNREWRFLCELNRYFTESIAAKLGCGTQFIDSKDMDLTGDRVERLINILRQLHASEYISGPLAWQYLQGSEHLFEENNIRLTLKDYSDYPPYNQMSEPFEQHVSIIDLIMNVGFEQAPRYIWGWREEEANHQ